MNILPPGIKPEPITIYNKSGDSYKRTVVQGVWFTSTDKAIYSKGALPLDTVSIYIFNFDGFTPQELDSKTGWTVAVSNSNKDTIIVRGNCNFRFKSKDPKGFTEELKLFKQNYPSFKRPRAFKDNRMGPPSHRHLVILC